jgi:scyllo-inositol 2-dehydrogenase (NADP+)
MVILATPTAVHADQAVAALNAGKHVVVDKPLTLTMAETDRMIAAAKANDRLLSVFQNRRFDGDYLTCHDVIENGSIGDVRWLEMAWQGFGPVTGWRADASQGGGRYWDLGAHLVDQALQFFPEPVASIYARRSYDYADSDTDSEATIIITFEGGRTAVCDLSGNSAYAKPRFCLHGSSGTFVKYGVDPQELAMIAGSIDGGIEQPESYGKIYTGSTITPVKTQPGRWRNYYENIAAAINGTAPLAISMDSVRKSMQVLTAGIESVESGNVVHF